MPHKPHWGYIVFIAIALFNAIRACFVDIFIDESESAPSELASEKHGLKATKITRPIMVTIFLTIAILGFWKMFSN